MNKTILKSTLALILAVYCSNINAQVVFSVEQPVEISDSYNFTNSYTADNWGANLDTVALIAEAAFALDATVADSLVCEPVFNTSEVEGKVAFIYRGDCEFGLKALNAQDSGAVAVVIINHSPGGLVNMLGGVNGTQVHIPVIFISDVDGAAMRDSILAGSVVVFLGNKTGFFANDLGYYSQDGISAKSFSTPHLLALDSNDFKVPIGTWIHNYGAETQNNVVLDAVIDHDGSEVYNETATVDSIPSGDSVFVALVTHGNDNYDAGYYTLTYSTHSDVVEDFESDNIAVKNWWINDNFYSKSRMDPTNGDPLGAGGLRPLDDAEYMWCSAMKSNNASEMTADGITFGCTTNADDSLNEVGVQVHFISWNDAYDGTVQPTFDDLDYLESGFYDYTTDQSGEFVTVTFDNPVELSNDQKYLACVEVFDDFVFIMTDNGIDYRGMDLAYPTDLFFPLKDAAGDWFGGGFGSENVPAIITNMSPVTGVEETDDQVNIHPYPNPASEMITIPLAGLSKTVDVLQVFDTQGKLIYIGDLISASASSITVDSKHLNAGMNNFILTFEDGTTNSFRVVVVK